jgi:Flp pilus assembly protein TadG
MRVSHWLDRVGGVAVNFALLAALPLAAVLFITRSM